MNTWRPQNTGNQANDRNLSQMMDFISSLAAQVQSLAGVKSQTLTTDQIKALVDPRALVQQFQADGSAPLNITGLLGITGTPQIAGVKSVNALPQPGDPLFVSTAAVVFSGALYINNGAGFVVTSSGVTSINASGGTTGLTFSGGPITSSGTLTLAGTLAIANGGTGGTTAATARTGLGIDPIATKKSNLTASAGPTVTDDSGSGYAIGSVWIDTAADNIYMATDVTVGAALWRQLN